MLRPHFSAPSALRQLSYLDTVSTVSLQRYNLHLYDFASELGISTLAGLTDDLLFNAMKAEWLASPEGTFFWNYVQTQCPTIRQMDMDMIRVMRVALAEFLGHPEARLTLPDVVSLRLYTGKG